MHFLLHFFSVVLLSPAARHIYFHFLLCFHSSFRSTSSSGLITKFDLTTLSIFKTVLSKQKPLLFTTKLISGSFSFSRGLYDLFVFFILVDSIRWSILIGLSRTLDLESLTLAPLTLLSLLTIILSTRIFYCISQQQHHFD